MKRCTSNSFISLLGQKVMAVVPFPCFYLELMQHMVSAMTRELHQLLCHGISLDQSCPCLVHFIQVEGHFMLALLTLSRWVTLGSG